MQALQKISCGNRDHGATDSMGQGMPHRTRKNKGKEEQGKQDEVITEQA